MTKSEIISKIKNGDYIVLGSMLGIDSAAARMRFKRDKPDALAAMEQIVKSREGLIETKK